MSGGARLGSRCRERTMLMVVVSALHISAGLPNTLADISLCCCLAVSCMLAILTFSTCTGNADGAEESEYSAVFS